VSQYIYFINAEELAKNVGNSRTMNIVMLGVLMGAEKIPIKKQTLEEAILQFVPKNAQDINKNAFQIGIDKGKSIMRELHE
jgi:Pyruvate/2-oxoacid:ferredoxin oxidoreductase gamma subunit